MKFFLLLLISVTFNLAEAENFLIIGDSLSCGPFGTSLTKKLRALEIQTSETSDSPDEEASKNNAILYCTESSSATHWVNGTNPAGHSCKTMSSGSNNLKLCDGTGATPKIETLLNQYKNYTVVIALGTNSLSSTTASRDYATIAEAIEKLKNKCHWVSPPDLDPTKASAANYKNVFTMSSNVSAFFNSLSAKVSFACTVHNSQAWTKKGTEGFSTSDGIHRTKAAGEYWAEQIKDILDNN